MPRYRIRSTRTATWDPGDGCDPVRFEVEPFSFTEAVERDARMNPPGGKVDTAAAAAVVEEVLARVRSIDGLDKPDGTPADCDVATLRALVTQSPDVLMALYAGAFGAVAAREDRKKNSSAGTGSVAPTTADSPAGRSTSTGTSAPPTCAVDDTGAPG